ncbi:MAG: hypothetical protein KGL39_14990 [Patescibacteria group bacterium]|nr:hypothetical protein [Patescibacteria group bacterium]
MENNQSATLPDAPQLSAAAGGDNVSEETVSLHDLVNKELGTNYVDDDAALAGLKQTKDYVGRVGQVMPFFDKAKALNIPTSKLFEAMDSIVNGNPQGSPASDNTDKFATKEQLLSLQRDMFYKDNPQFASYRQAIDEVSNATGKSPADIVAMESFKTLITNAAGFDEVQKAKSVLQTNSRLGVASDNLTKAQESMKAGDVAGAQAHAMDAVMEVAYGKK